MGLIRTMAGIGAGAGIMYFLDPDRGRRRRVVAGDQLTSLGRRLGRALRKGLRDAGNRTHGLAAVVRHSVHSREEVDDDRLVARVRSRIGRAVSHPHAIEVGADHGRVTLRGHVLREEMNNLINTVEETEGVRQVVNQVEAHDRSENFPVLQGGRQFQGEVSWPPALRLIVGATGGGLAVYSVAKRDTVSLAAGIVGLGLIARATTNRDFTKLLADGGPRKMVNVQKTIHVNAPVDEVYEFWANCGNFPRFMRHLREVTAQGDKRTRWVAAGPEGTPISWDAEITAEVPGEVLAWGSVRGSVIDQTGLIRLQPEGLGTRMDVRLSYQPPPGTVGHLVASLFGPNPKRELEEDLVRLKGLLEQDRVRGVVIQELEGFRSAEPEIGL